MNEFQVTVLARDFHFNYIGLPSLLFFLPFVRSPYRYKFCFDQSLSRFQQILNKKTSSSCSSQSLFLLTSSDEFSFCGRWSSLGNRARQIVGMMRENVESCRKYSFDLNVANVDERTSRLNFLIEATI